MCYFSGLGVYLCLESKQSLVLLQQILVPQVLNTYAEPETSDTIHFVCLSFIEHVPGCMLVHNCPRNNAAWEHPKGTKRCGEHFQQSQSPVTV